MCTALCTHSPVQLRICRLEWCNKWCWGLWILCFDKMEWEPRFLREMVLTAMYSNKLTQVYMLHRVLEKQKHKWCCGITLWIRVKEKAIKGKVWKTGCCTSLDLQEMFSSHLFSFQVLIGRQSLYTKIVRTLPTGTKCFSWPLC